MSDLSQFAKQVKETNKRIEVLSKTCRQLEQQISSAPAPDTSASKGMSFSADQYKKVYGDLVEIKKVMLHEQKEYAKINESNTSLLKENSKLSDNIDTLKKAIVEKTAAIDALTPKKKQGGEKFSLPSLPWERNALQPHISEETINFHYGKHHTGYVKKLNAALSAEAAKEFVGLSLEELIKKAPQGKMWNCAAQHWNHSFYWNSMSGSGGGNPTGAIAKKIDEDFGSFEKFKAEFTAAAAGHFGSGWAWLLLKGGKLVVGQTHNAGCPISTDQGKPILTCDVWEHAYYVDYRNDRGSYINAWWKLANWNFANSNLGSIQDTKDEPKKEADKPKTLSSTVAEKFSLPSLPWERNALQPHISEETINFHYGKHHAGYVKKLNAALSAEAAKEFGGLSLEELIKKAPQGKMWNCAAQHWNHSFYWNSMSGSGGGNPTGAIAKKIDEDFGSFEKFKAEFTAAAAGHFGSGWAWLLLKDGKLVVGQTHNAGCPISTDQGKPILTCDVWEHAYYVDYRNDRGSYINAWWKLVNWNFANTNLAPTQEVKEEDKEVAKKQVEKKKNGKKKNSKKNSKKNKKNSKKNKDNKKKGKKGNKSNKGKKKGK